MKRATKEQVEAAMATLSERDRRIIEVYSDRRAEQNNWFVKHRGVWTLMDEIRRAKHQTRVELGVTEEDIDAAVARWSATWRLWQDERARRATEMLA